MFMGMTAKNEARELRPSLNVAEALVNRHGPKQIEDRARRLGYSRGLTDVVVAACCGCADGTPAPRFPRPNRVSTESFQS